MHEACSKKKEEKLTQIFVRKHEENVPPGEQRL
jgi:hypothetical protein